MDAEQTIAEIEWLERTFAVRTLETLSPSDLAAANRRHDEMLAHCPWFGLWQRYGLCCRSEAEAGRGGRFSSTFPSSASISNSLRIPIRMPRPAE
jgi:hypothetical protein